MIAGEKIQKFMDEMLQDTDMFLVGIKQSPSNEIEIVIDSDTVVGIDFCVAVNKAFNEVFDREEEDFELTVMSAGVGQPLVLLRQYQKLIGKEVEVLLNEGTKQVATLKALSEEALTLCYSEKVAVEGKKRKESVECERIVPFDTIKSTREHLIFK